MHFPISIKCFVAPTDEEAKAQALKYLPEFFALQVRHYQSDDAPWDNIKGYQQFNKMFANLRLLSDPANLGGYINQNLVGLPETVARLTCPGIFHPVATRVRPKEGMDDEANNSNRRTDHWDPA